MRRLLMGSLWAVCVLGAVASAQRETSPGPEIDHLAAFARLYGVVRYFHPSDAAAGLDWNRFAVHGVQRVRAARDAAALETTLKSLFGPLGSGIEIGRTLPTPPAAGTPDEALIAWRYMGAGMTPTSGASPYKSARLHRTSTAADGSIEGFVTVLQNVPADDLRGKTVRLRGLVRATPRDAAASAALWLRVDRSGGQMGFFDNMGNRPVRDAAWREYAIEGQVADDAMQVAFGVMGIGAVTADFDMIRLEVRDAAGGWTPVPVKDGDFEAAASAGTGTGSPGSGARSGGGSGGGSGVGASGWTRAGNASVMEITRPTEQAPEGRQFLRFSPPSRAASGSASEPAAGSALFEAPAPATGAHVDVDLGAGLKARVPLALSDAAAKGTGDASRELASLRAALTALPDSVSAVSADVSVADAIVAWNVFRHFYPYWMETAVDWDARLRPLLTLANAATTRAAHRDALRQLVADVRDGHGTVSDVRAGGQRGTLPIRLRVIEKQLVITATAVPAQAPVGGVVSRIDGESAATRLAEAMRLASGTTQWKESRALQEMVRCSMGANVTLAIENESGRRAGARTGIGITPPPVTLSCATAPQPPEPRPEPVAELSPGLWYVDLTRATMAQVRPAIEKLAGADGVVFDVRGYPTDAGAQVLPYLLREPESTRWMHVAKIVGPFGQSVGWQSMGWNLSPAPTRVGGTKVFLTDGRAISYAESVLGYVADLKLAAIVGSPTAGANGNVARFVVPGGFNITFTGMRVTGHDGLRQHHLIGVQPTVAAEPTIDGIRRGRDEVLERAIALIRGR